VELAKEVVAEYEKQKKKLDWPEKKRLLTTATKGPQMGSEFPADVWKETNRRWNKLTSDEKEQWTSTAEKILRTRIEMARSSALDRGFDASFGPFDILWFLLAAATAFRIGSRVVVADD